MNLPVTGSPPARDGTLLSASIKLSSIAGTSIAGEGETWWVCGLTQGPMTGVSARQEGLCISVSVSQVLPDMPEIYIVDASRTWHGPLDRHLPVSPSLPHTAVLLHGLTALGHP